MKRSYFFALLTHLILILSACKHSSRESKVDALPQARAILGPAFPRVSVKLDPELMKASMSERRKAGWKIAAEVLQRVPITHPKTGQAMLDPMSGQPLNIPLWQTWYEVNEFRTMFEDMYWGKLTEEQRKANEAPDAIVDEVMSNHHLRTLPLKWTRPSPEGTTRFDKFLGQLTGPSEASALNGVSGRGYTLYSPAVMRHYLKHFGAAYACTGTDPNDVSTDASRDFATCLGAEFPPEAVAIKATWSSAIDGVARFDTSARGLARTFSTEQPTWEPINKDNLAQPSAQDIYHSSSFNDDQPGEAFRLTGLHILTKDTPEWMWVTLWWSTQAHEDFGEDRPPALKGLGPPGADDVWTNYKMCVSSTFDEGDAALKAKLATLTVEELKGSSDTSLAKALESGSFFTKPHSFCSNPYIEFQKGAAKTNCIGCHQHAGPFASNAKQKNTLGQERKSFMTDFMWSFENFIDNFRGAISDVIENGGP